MQALLFDAGWSSLLEMSVSRLMSRRRSHELRHTSIDAVEARVNEQPVLDAAVFKQNMSVLPNFLVKHSSKRSGTVITYVLLLSDVPQPNEDDGGIEEVGQSHNAIYSIVGRDPAFNSERSYVRAAVLLKQCITFYATYW